MQPCVGTMETMVETLRQGLWVSQRKRTVDPGRVGGSGLSICASTQALGGLHGGDRDLL